MIRAVIGVWRNGPRTFYVKRSERLTNYPGIWSLPSFQFDLVLDFDAPRIFRELSRSRFGGTAIVVGPQLISGSSNENPMNEWVTLFLYEIEFVREPWVNTEFYTDSAFMTQEEYEIATADVTCGLCTRLWANYQGANRHA
jgi:hypothetical protein